MCPGQRAGTLSGDEQVHKYKQQEVISIIRQTLSIPLASTTEGQLRTCITVKHCMYVDPRHSSITSIQGMYVNQRHVHYWYTMYVCKSAIRMLLYTQYV